MSENENPPHEDTQLTNPDWNDDTSVTIEIDLTSPEEVSDVQELAYAIRRGVVKPGKAKGNYVVDTPGSGDYVGSPAHVSGWLKGFKTAIHLERGTYPAWDTDYDHDVFDHFETEEDTDE